MRSFTLALTRNGVCTVGSAKKGGRLPLCPSFFPFSSCAFSQNTKLLLFAFFGDEVFFGFAFEKSEACNFSIVYKGFRVLLSQTTINDDFEVEDEGGRDRRVVWLDVTIIVVDDAALFCTALDVSTVVGGAAQLATNETSLPSLVNDRLSTTLFHVVAARTGPSTRCISYYFVFHFFGYETDPIRQTTTAVVLVIPLPLQLLLPPLTAHEHTEQVSSGQQ